MSRRDIRHQTSRTRPQQMPNKDGGRRLVRRSRHFGGCFEDQRGELCAALLRKRQRFGCIMCASMCLLALFSEVYCFFCLSVFSSRCADLKKTRPTAAQQYTCSCCSLGQIIRHCCAVLFPAGVFFADALPKLEAELATSESLRRGLEERLATALRKVSSVRTAVS